MMHFHYGGEFWFSVQTAHFIKPFRLNLIILIKSFYIHLIHGNVKINFKHGISPSVKTVNVSKNPFQTFYPFIRRLLLKAIAFNSEIVSFVK